MGQVQTVTMRDFRRMDPLSGNVCVVGGSRRRRGVRHASSQAISRSQESRAASDDERGKTAGRGATSTSAPAAVREACAEAAKGKAGETGRTPAKKEKESRGNKQSTGGDGTDERGVMKPKDGQLRPRIWIVDDEVQAVEELPEDGLQFAQAVNREIYLVGKASSLLQEKDARVRQHVWDRLMDMAYGKSSRAAVRPVQTIINDLPEPLRD